MFRDPEFRYDRELRCTVMNTSVFLPHPREHIFNFFSDAVQLERITPKWVNFQILTPTPIHIQKGTLIDYKIRLRGIPMTWRTEISDWNPPFQFTDRQLRGPYLLWEHTHRFEEVDGGTLMTDEVHYRVPGGRLINWLLVQNDVNRIFIFRRQTMLELFGGTEHGSTEQDGPALLKSPAEYSAAGSERSQ
jgi:ligand-binding SRPBCC domain-containing protein